MFFDAAAIHFDRMDGHVDRAIYRVTLPQLSYDGWVRVTGTRHAAPGTEQWIAEQLDDLAARNGYDVICGRLYSPVDLTV